MDQSGVADRGRSRNEGRSPPGQATSKGQGGAESSPDAGRLGFIRSLLGLLVAAILKNVAGERARSISLSADAIYSLLEHGWPHNVRELEQRLKTAVALAVDGRIERARLWNSRGDGAPARGGSSRGPRSPEDDALAAELAQHLTTYRGNVTRVGDAMGKSRTQVQRWLRRLGIDAERFRR